MEASEFRDEYEKFRRLGVVVLGVSPDTPAAQKKFKDKFDLPFSLLCDTDKKVAQAYGVLKEKNMYGKKVMGVVRSTFVVGPDGKLAQVFENVKPEGHAAQVLAALKMKPKGDVRASA